MPKSKHRRNNKTRPRKSTKSGPPVKAPEPSPPWVPRTGASLIGVGVLVILLGYLPAIGDVIDTWPVFGPNWSLVAGFVFLAGGFGVLTRWQ